MRPALRILAAFVLAGLWAGGALAQSDPGLYNGQVPTATQWNSFFASKMDYPLVVCPPQTLYGNPTGGSAAPSCNAATSTTGVGSALKWVSPRTLTFTGDLAGTITFDGSANVSASLPLSTTGVTAGLYGDTTHSPQFTVDAKGRITGVTNVVIAASTGTVTTSGSPSAGQLAKFSAGTVITNAVSGTDYAPATSGAAILKGNGSGGFSAATAGTDYIGATSGSAIQKANGAGGLTAAVPGTDYVALTANTFTGLQTFSAGAVVTPEATPATNEAGFLGAPENVQNASYALVMADAGKLLYHTNASAHTYTIPANASVAYPIGTTIVIANEHGAGALTLSITTDTLRWTTLTGSRTVAADGTVTLLKVDSTTWRLTGDGIS